MITREQVVSAAMGWVDTPWRWHGRDARGLDCGGLIEVVGAEVGGLRRPPARPTYPRPLPRGYLLQQLRTYLHERNPVQPRRGCGSGVDACCEDCRQDLIGAVVYLGRLGVQHCGICTGDQLVHIAADRRCVIVDLGDRLRRAITRVFDYDGLQRNG